MILAYINGTLFEEKQNWTVYHRRQAYNSYSETRFPPRPKIGDRYCCSRCGKLLGKVKGGKKRSKLQKHHYRGYLEDNYDKILWLGRDCHNKHHVWVEQMERQRKIQISIMLAFVEILSS